MKHLVSILSLVVAAATLSGCYYDPGYSYVRGSAHAGDAYYGDGGNATYVSPAYGGYGGYYGGGYDGCCYAPGVSVGISSTWYGDSGYRRDDYRGRRDYGSHAGHWQEHSGGNDRRGDSRRDSSDESHGGSERDSHDGTSDLDGGRGRRDGERHEIKRADDRR